jgi:hypothetical protein
MMFHIPPKKGNGFIKPIKSDGISLVPDALIEKAAICSWFASQN